MDNADKKIAQQALSFFKGTPEIFRYYDENETKFVDLLSCEDVPFEGVCSFSTLGLFRTDIGLTFNNNPLRAELLGACDIDVEDFSNIITTTAFEIMDSNELHPGTVISNVIPMYIPDSDMKHMLITYPFLWDDVNNLQLDNLTVAWLMAIPISENEKKYLEKYGLDKLEELFEKEEIDVADIYRNSVV